MGLLHRTTRTDTDNAVDSLADGNVRIGIGGHPAFDDVFPLVAMSSTVLTGRVRQGGDRRSCRVAVIPRGPMEDPSPFCARNENLAGDCAVTSELSAERQALKVTTPPVVPITCSQEMPGAAVNGVSASAGWVAPTSPALMANAAAAMREPERADLATAWVAR